MSTLTASDFIIYSGLTYKPIGCGVSGTFDFSVEEIITTSKGSGRATNREYGRYDWSFEVECLIDLPAGAETPYNMLDIVKSGYKVLVFGQIAGPSNDRFGGVGIVSNFNMSGQAGEFMRATFTVLGDGELYITDGLKEAGTKGDAFVLSATLTAQSSYTNTALIGKSVRFVTVADLVTPFTFNSTTGVITFSGAETGTLNVFVSSL